LQPEWSAPASTSRDGTLRVWDFDTGRELLTFRGQSGSSSVASQALSLDGSRWASATDREVKLRLVKAWDSHPSQDALTFKLHPSFVYSLPLSPEGKRGASGHADGTIKIGNALTGQALFALPGSRPRVYAVAFGPDGKRLAGASQDGYIRVWDTQTGDRLHEF